MRDKYEEAMGQVGEGFKTRWNCDGFCGRSEDDHEAAKKAGYIRVAGNRDLCPECAAKEARVMNP